MEDVKLNPSLSNDGDAPNASKALSSFMSIWVTSDPIGIKIIPSGWTDPRMYHVLVEWGDREETDYHFLDASQIKEQMDIEISEDDFVSYIVTKDEVRELSNDSELGNHIRTALIK
jgi:hypothetical protein